MSLFGSLTTAISGLNAQAKALGFISDNVANSQTNGFKRIDTNFEDQLALSSARSHVSGAVTASADATVTLQGPVQRVENPLSMALSGNGLFSVARPSGNLANGDLTFDNRPMFSRAGDFSRDASGYLLNGSGYALQGWGVTNGVVDQTALVPIRIDETPFPPTPSTSLTLAANLPATPDGTVATQAQVYDSVGQLRAVQFDWTRLANDQWQVTASSGGTVMGTEQVTFNANGTLASGGTTNPAGQNELTFNLTGGAAPQPIALNIGTIGSADGLTQFAGTSYSQRSLVGDGSAAGAFSSVAIRTNGDVVANYDNGVSRTFARVPVVTFPNADALERMDGQAFALTEEAGTMRVQAAGAQGAGTIATQSVELSNVDIAAEFSKLIVAQRAYTANTRIVTASDEMLTETINMRR